MALVSVNVFQGGGDSISGFPDEVSLSRNRKGSQSPNPLLEAPELEQNLVNFGLPRTDDSF